MILFHLLPATCTTTIMEDKGTALIDVYSIYFNFIRYFTTKKFQNLALNLSSFCYD